MKLCGMTSPADVAACVAAGADALGFIFARSPRRVTLQDGRAQSLIAAVPPHVTSVGIFAGDEAALVRAALAACRLDMLQFAGGEDYEFCGSFGVPTLLVARRHGIGREQRLIARAAAVLVDADVRGKAGGTGVLVDSGTFARIRAESPGARVLLAGGLNPDNVAGAIRALDPDGVDARTGVEIDGAKDAGLAARFVSAARGAYDERARARGGG
ncbi:MAG TPA: phosphoribosylanthranilate isomerase [Candidatus Eremiobacteraceae bacterium]|nr:phosphoribosylanthranilate isomerase [Candidatus Eremiobacteraceae bacterium]